MNINKEAECEVVKKQIQKTQKDWIKYFNKKGEKMISAADIYQLAKEENKGLIESLQKDFKDMWVITSTRVIYNKDDLNAEIIHDADSTIVKPKVYGNIKIPDYGEEAKENPDTEAYLQALFDTEDKIDIILKILKRFDSNKKIYLWTPSQSSRRDKQIRSVGLDFDFLDRFDVDGDNWFGDYCGFSRGVLVSSAKQSKKSEAKK